MLSIEDLKKQGTAWKAMAHISEPLDDNGKAKPFVVEIEVRTQLYPLSTSFRFYFSDKNDFALYHNIFGVLGESVFNYYLTNPAFPKESEQLINAQKSTPISLTLKDIQVAQEDASFCSTLLMDALNKNPNLVEFTFSKEYLTNELRDFFDSVKNVQTDIRKRNQSFEKNNATRMNKLSEGAKELEHAQIYYFGVLPALVIAYVGIFTSLTWPGLILLSACFGVGCFTLTRAIEFLSKNHDEEKQHTSVAENKGPNIIEEPKKGLFFQKNNTPTVQKEVQTNPPEVQPNRPANVRLV